MSTDLQNGLRTYRPNLSQYTYCSERAERDIKTWLVGCEAGTATRSLLLTGPTGLGKTTLALALSDGLGVNPQDIRQVNCGDLRTLEDARDLINSSLAFGPSFGTYRVLVLDECHQMVPNAQKAFLTPLEQLSGRIIVIGCTSNPEMLQAPFRGRFYQIALEPYTEDALVDILMGLPEPPEPGNAVIAARSARGNPRAAIAMIEKGVTEQDAEELKAETFRIENFIEAIITYSPARALQIVSALKPDQTVKFVSETCYILEAIWLSRNKSEPMVPSGIKELIQKANGNNSHIDIAWLYRELQAAAFLHPNHFKGIVMGYFDSRPRHPDAVG